MGLLDGIGSDLGSLTSLLGGLTGGAGGITNLVDPGAIVHAVVDSVLPQDMQWVGGAAGTFVDFESGNALGALTQGMSALHDLADVAQSSGSDKAASGTANKSTSGLASTSGSKSALEGSGAGASFDQEPSPPPRLVTTSITQPGGQPVAAPSRGQPAAAPSPGGGTASPSVNLLQLAVNPLELLKQLLSGLGKPSATSGSRAGAPAATTAATSPGSPGTTTTTTTTTTTLAGAPFGAAVSAAGASGPLRSASSAVSASMQPPSRVAGGGSSTPAGSSDSPKASSKPSTADPSTLSMDSFMKLSDDDLMKAVREGKIPQDVTDSQSGMLALQSRMDHISEMNQMMTTMMQSIHQMKMSVVENIKA